MEETTAPPPSNEQATQGGSGRGDRDRRALGSFQRKRPLPNRSPISAVSGKEKEKEVETDCRGHEGASRTNPAPDRRYLDGRRGAGSWSFQFPPVGENQDRPPRPSRSIPGTTQTLSFLDPFGQRRRRVSAGKLLAALQARPRRRPLPFPGNLGTCTGRAGTENEGNQRQPVPPRSTFPRRTGRHGRGPGVDRGPSTVFGEELGAWAGGSSGKRGPGRGGRLAIPVRGGASLLAMDDPPGRNSEEGPARRGTVRAAEDGRSPRVQDAKTKG